MSTLLENDTYQDLFGKEVKGEPYSFVSKIETTFIKEYRSFYPNTWDNISLRWRTIIDRMPYGKVRVIVGLTQDEINEIDFIDNQKEISIFGSYNRATICDIRCTGILKKKKTYITKHLETISERFSLIKKLSNTERDHPAKLPRDYDGDRINNGDPDKDQRIMIEKDISNIISIYVMYPESLGYSVYQK